MKNFLFILIVLIVNLISVEGQVIQLTSNNISQYLQKHVTFVKFYSNWCPHSKKFEPVWNKFAEIKGNTDVRVAKIDCSNEALLCSDHDVFGYPTVKLFIKGSGARYEGPRDINSLQAFYQEIVMKNKKDQSTGKSTIVDLNQENFPEKTKQNFAFVMFFAPWCHHCQVLKPIFEELTEEMSTTEGLTFGTVDCTKENTLCSNNGIRGYPTLIWFEKGVEIDRYIKSRDVDSMRAYIEQNMKTPKLVDDLEPSATIEPTEKIENFENFEKFDRVVTSETFGKGISFEGYAFVNFGAPWCSHCQKLLPLWNQLAQRFSSIDAIRIFRVDCTVSEPLCRDYGVRAFPTMIFFRYGESKIEYNGPRDFKSLYNFLVSQLESYGDEYLLEKNSE